MDVDQAPRVGLGESLTDRGAKDRALLVVQGVSLIVEDEMKGSPALSVGRFSWSAGEGWAESAAGEVGHGDERVGAVVAIGAAGE